MVSRIARSWMDAVRLAGAATAGGRAPSPSHLTSRMTDLVFPRYRVNHSLASDPSSPARPSHSHTPTLHLGSGLAGARGTSSAVGIPGAVIVIAASGGRIPSHDGDRTSEGSFTRTSASLGSVRCVTKTLALGFARRFFGGGGGAGGVPPSVSADSEGTRASSSDRALGLRLSTSIHARSYMKPVSVTVTASTSMPAQDLTG